MSEEDRRAKQGCERFLSQHVAVPPAQYLELMARHPTAREAADLYGDGGAVAALEARTADLLGKPAARFFIKGVIAQLCVLRVHAEAAGTANVAIHPMSHLDLDEANAIERVGAVRAIRLGRFAPFGVGDLEKVTEKLASVVVELPLRRAGYLLPALDELRAISDWCRGRGVPLHFDGARLWEAAAGYGVPLDELAALADSVYVSFYKGLGGLGGAVVAGAEDLIGSLAPWKTRYGGNLYTAFPYAISALAGLDRQLPRMAEFVARARSIAARLGRNPEWIVNPPTPHVNAFQLLLNGSPGDLARRNREFAEARRVWLFGSFAESAIEGRSIAEIVIGDASGLYTDEEAAGWIADFAAS
jgi:threonine aldolase